ncbi:protein SIEVE ELEMENT OCCLUSION B-like [Humulus lupulus]|uniref:protein SIEVE ELEMENT OCCLUSION B-like n=1 Tax=Humulus lupulus TaxID=3486 RepID=UPI002B410298|nr:protein SIEVE ELEMENT OCCLUSION B-like [Humulus lupulus]
MAEKLTQAIIPRFQSGGKSDLSRKHMISDDSTMVRQIRETHSPETHYLDVKPIILVIEDIFRRTAPGIDAMINGTHIDAGDEKGSVSSVDEMLEALAHIIHKISCEMFCKCSGSDLHASTLVLFKMLSYYPWEAKVVLALAAFSVTYGEFWLVTQLCTTNPLAKAVALLKQVSDMIENLRALKPQLEAIHNLISAIMKVTKLIVEFNDLPTEYLSQDSEQLSVGKAHIPAAAYWTIRSIIACAWHVASLTDFRYEHIASASELWELSSLAHKLVSIHDLLALELNNCRKYIAKMQHEEHYKNLVRLIEGTTHLDNMKILKALLAPAEEQTLVYGYSKAKVSVEVLRRKHVLLLISDFDITHEELTILSIIYDMRMKQDQRYDTSSKDTPYEVVWIPMVDRMTNWRPQREQKLSELQSKMPWYYVENPDLIEPPVIKYIRERWNFEKKIILVALDPSGKVTSKNATHMMWIWGNSALPFSQDREDTLWSGEQWSLKLLIDSIEPETQTWMNSNKYICLYGGDNIDWIRQFTTQAKVVAQAFGIELELLYVGKSNVPKERINKINATIQAENLSHIWPDSTSIWFFWSRLESMRCSKVRYGKTIEDDPILKEAMILLSYDGSDQGWASLWRGSNEMARANGQLALKTLNEFQIWEPETREMTLIPALNVELQRRHSPQHCTRLILPGIGQDIPPKVVCTECGRDMEKFFMFRCCTD